MMKEVSMLFLGIDIDTKNLPELDNSFVPLGAFIDGYLKTAKKPVAFVVVRSEKAISVFDTFIHGTSDMREVDQFFASRVVKFMLWAYGGYEILICGDEDIAAHLKEEYSDKGTRAFDAAFMAHVYEREFAVRFLPLNEKPGAKGSTISIGGNFDGCRIGFDAGGSDRKVSAVNNGEVVYSEEVIWNPKQNDDPEYHYQGIMEAFITAASKLPKVDAIGVSSAGIYVDNRTMVASLFLKIPPELFEEKVKNIYIRAASEIGDVPLVVANDGDVAALAGAMELNSGSVLGIAMGTSQAAGYVDCDRNVTGWLNELAFVPIDCNPKAMEDEWSGDIGCGVKYFSQDGVIRLAEAAGIDLNEELSFAEKLETVQALMENHDERAESIFRSIGVYLAHTVNLYTLFYDIENIQLLGRVMSGNGGALILATALAVLSEEYPALSKQIRLVLPDESSRRVGQAIAAAGLPRIKDL